MPDAINEARQLSIWNHFVTKSKLLRIKSLGAVGDCICSFGRTFYTRETCLAQKTKWNRPPHLDRFRSHGKFVRVALKRQCTMQSDTQLNQSHNVVLYDYAKCGDRNGRRNLFDPGDAFGRLRL
jgi:hypothetical protein